MGIARALITNVGCKVVWDGACRKYTVSPLGAVSLVGGVQGRGARGFAVRSDGSNTFQRRKRGIAKGGLGA